MLYPPCAVRMSMICESRSRRRENAPACGGASRSQACGLRSAQCRLDSARPVAREISVRAAPPQGKRRAVIALRSDSVILGTRDAARAQPDDGARRVVTPWRRVCSEGTAIVIEPDTRTPARGWRSAPRCFCFSRSPSFASTKRPIPPSGSPRRRPGSISSTRCGSISRPESERGEERRARRH